MSSISVIREIRGSFLLVETATVENAKEGRPRMIPMGTDQDSKTARGSGGCGSGVRVFPAFSCDGFETMRSAKNDLTNT